MVSFIWMFIDDNDDAFKVYQRAFRKMEIETAEKKLLAEIEKVKDQRVSYDNKLLDIFNVQDEIAGEIVSKLDEKLNISKSEISATKRASTQNMEAYSLVQQAGETLLNQKISGENTYNIISPLLEKAVALDSTYADALAYLAIAKITRYEDEEAADYVEKEIKAFGEATILVEKHYYLSQIMNYHWDFL